MPGTPRSPTLCLFVAVALTVGLSACKGGYKAWTDRAVFGVIQKKTSRIPNADDVLLSITPPTKVNLDKAVSQLKPADFLGDRAHVEAGGKIVSLADTLRFAVTNNRTYLGAKETVYLTALDYTSVSRQYELVPGAAATARENYVNKSVAPIAPATLNSWIVDHTQTASAGVGLSTLTRIGTRIAADLTTDFLRLVTGQRPGVANSALAVTLAQPLLQGAGSLTAMEPIRQADRDVLYAVRNFTQYRKTFTVDTTNLYFDTLLARTQAANAFMVYKSLQKNYVTVEALVDATRPGRTKSSLAVFKAAELNAQRRWIDAVRIYEEKLDDLKIHLTVPVTQKIVLDQRDFERLTIEPVNGTLDEAIAAAMTSRLDVWNARDSLADAERKVKIARQNRLPRVDVVGGYRKQGTETQGVKLDDNRYDYNVGLDIDLNLDQRPARNALRAAEVTEQATRRALDLAEENVRKQVRASWRNLEVAQKQHELAVTTYAFAENRLEMEQALTAAGTADPRNSVDAQNFLITARDQLNAALVNHVTSRIELFRDMGVLAIRKDGSWADVLKTEPVGKP